ncbi:lipocalin-like domain-containing protein [Paraburkholderia flagellata]|uniref:lipocalin-like domain-containing protein n=1 Tax=Paraburkholderia flagellata TaxID=2883241 RepID=UPI001F291FC5|nr:lipocalin-like domain-containing protein [Paraburkholderia flagellata]
MARARQTGSAALLGTWKLQSFTTEDLATGEKTDLFGAHPVGYLNYGADKRMYAILLEENRNAPADLVPTDAERIALFNGLCAYAGTWSIEGDLVSHHVDTSWNESWTGTIQLRRFRIDGKYLHITTLPARNPVTGKECISELVWLKVE